MRADLGHLTDSQTAVLLRMGGEIFSPKQLNRVLLEVFIFLLFLTRWRLDLLAGFIADGIFSLVISVVSSSLLGFFRPGGFLPLLDILFSISSS